uniref:Uncharacterized protein n=1 Tax=Cucumis melo TaxID=3656 RepID=A0A9I9EF21_CUCME
MVTLRVNVEQLLKDIDVNNGNFESEIDEVKFSNSVSDNQDGNRWRNGMRAIFNSDERGSRQNM